jgi:hypothetical protein
MYAARWPPASPQEIATLGVWSVPGSLSTSLVPHPTVPAATSQPGSIPGATSKATDVASLAMADDRKAPHVGLSRSPVAVFDDRDPAADEHADPLDGDTPG